jgi:hypothetical protein
MCAIAVKEMVGEYRLLETVFENRGRQIKIFLDMAAATRWLNAGSGESEAAVE